MSILHAICSIGDLSEDFVGSSILKGSGGL